MKLFGIPVRVDFSFWIVCLILASSRASFPILIVEWAIVVFVSILVHELGHALCIKGFGHSPEITLYSMGGLTSWTDSGRLSHWKRVLISLAGPGAGFLFGTLGVILRLAQPDLFASQLMKIAYRDFLWVNFGWGVINLLPILPLDGGQVTASLEAMISDDTKGRVTRIVSVSTSIALAWIGFTYGLVGLLILGAWFAFSNGSVLFQEVQTFRDRNFRGMLIEGWLAVKQKNYGYAVALANEAFHGAKSTAVREEALYLLFHSSVSARDFNRAEDALRRLEPLSGPLPHLRGLVWLRSGRVSEALELLAQAFHAAPSPQVGFQLGHALLRSGRYDELFRLCEHPALKTVRRKLHQRLLNRSFARREFKTSVQAGELAFASKPNPETAYKTARAWSRLQNPQNALLWLEKAVASGFSDETRIIDDPDFAELRIAARKNDKMTR